MTRKIIQNIFFIILSIIFSRIVKKKFPENLGWYSIHCFIGWSGFTIFQIFFDF
jgi:hypothetical protein